MGETYILIGSGHQVVGLLLIAAVIYWVWAKPFHVPENKDG